MKRVTRNAMVAVLMAVAGCSGNGEEAVHQDASTTTGSSASAPDDQASGSSSIQSGPKVMLSGRIHFAGPPPEPQELKMKSDPVCTQAHEGALLYPEDIVVNANGTLKNVFVYVKTGLEGQVFDVPEESVTLDQKGCVYVPHVLGMMVGQDLKIINNDPTLHNVHALTQIRDNKEFNLGMSRQGMQFTKTFSHPEVMVRVKCDVHPWMEAYIGVLSHPFHAVSDEEGSFTIPDLPAGTYNIAAWHEEFGEQEKTISVGDVPEVELEFTFAAEGS